MTLPGSPRRVSAVALAIAGLVPAWSSAAASAATPAPSVGVVAFAALAPGSAVKVVGQGWPANAVVQVSICGDGGFGGSDTCATTAGVDVPATPDGKIWATLNVAIPPAPCPCVVQATSPSVTAPVSGPISIRGAASRSVRAPATDPIQPLQVRASLAAPQVLPSFLGLGSRSRLRVRLYNPNNVALSALEVAASAGRGTDPNGFVAPVNLAELAPHASAVVYLYVPTGPLSVGSYRATGHVLVGGRAYSFAATGPFVLPWLLIALGLLSIQLVLIGVRNRVRAVLFRRVDGPVVSIDLRESVSASAPAYARLAFVVPEHSLSGAFEWSSGPDGGSDRVSLHVWDEYSGLPWDVAWDWQGTGSRPGPRRFDLVSEVGERSIRLSFEPDAEAGVAHRPLLRTGRITGTLRLGAEEIAIDCRAAMVSATGERGEGSLCYAAGDEGSGFIVEVAGHSCVSGWLSSGGVAAPVVEATRTVQGRRGPFPLRLELDLTDALGRRVSATGYTLNGLASQPDQERISWTSSTLWSIDGQPAWGEDITYTSVLAWRSRPRGRSAASIAQAVERNRDRVAEAILT